MSRRLAPWLLAGVGLAIAVTLALVATPERIWTYARRVAWPGPAVAFAWAALTAIARGVRLSLLLGRRTTVDRAVAAAGVAQLAVAILPWRAGELALVPALRAAGLPGTLRAISVLVVIRVLDLGTLLVWAVAAAVLLGAPLGVAPFALLGLAVAAWLAWRGAAALLTRLARGWRRPAGLRRALLRQALQARRELRRAARSPIRIGGAVICSLIAWAGVWGLCVSLVRAMGLDWSTGAVLLAVIGASLAAAVPINAVGSFGTLEAGWAASLAATGASAAEALASGFAVHLWSLLFSIVLGGLAGVVLAARRSTTPASQGRADATIRRRSDTAA